MAIRHFTSIQRWVLFDEGGVLADFMLENGKEEEVAVLRGLTETKSRSEGWFLDRNHYELYLLFVEYGRAGLLADGSKRAMIYHLLEPWVTSQPPDEDSEAYNHLLSFTNPLHVHQEDRGPQEILLDWMAGMVSSMTTWQCTWRWAGQKVAGHPEVERDRVEFTVYLDNKFCEEHYAMETSEAEQFTCDRINTIVAEARRHRPVVLADVLAADVNVWVRIATQYLQHKYGVRTGLKPINAAEIDIRVYAPRFPTTAEQGENSHRSATFSIISESTGTHRELQISRLENWVRDLMNPSK